MSLDIYLMEMRPVEVFETNITHNLNRMAKAAGIYKHLWRPEEIGIAKACDLIEPLSAARDKMLANPDKYKQFDASNGWGTYEQFVPWLERYLDACRTFPNAQIQVSR